MATSLYDFYWAKLYIHNNDLISSHLIRYGNWESYHDNIISEYIKKDSIVLDIGANIGIFTTKCANKCKCVYSFEPYIKNYELLIKNININNFYNVIPFFIAISNNLGITKINWITPNNLGAIGLDISLDKDTNYCKYIKSISNNKIDNVDIMTNKIDNLNLGKVDFIKIDTEGCEILCIQGALNTLKKYKPIILMEHNSEQQKIEILNFLYENNLTYIQKHIDKNDYLYTYNYEKS